MFKLLTAANYPKAYWLKVTIILLAMISWAELSEVIFMFYVVSAEGSWGLSAGTWSGLESWWVWLERWAQGAYT